MIEIKYHLFRCCGQKLHEVDFTSRTIVCSKLDAVSFFIIHAAKPVFGV